MSEQIKLNPSKVEDISAEVQQAMLQKGRETGSKPVQHLAEGLQAQHDLMVDKDLLERFERISKSLDEVRRKSPKEFERTQKQIESLRPLLRLSLRSVDFREMLMSLLRVLKHVWEDNIEGQGDAENVLEKGEKQGMGAAKEEAKKQGQQVWNNLKDKKAEQLIRDEDWEKMNAKLDEIFSQLRSHPEYQNAIHQLFDLPSTFKKEVQENKPDKATEKVKEESKDLIAQFSGRDILDKLFDQIEELRERFENNEKVQKWWSDFREELEKTAKGYAGKEDLDQLRDLLEQTRDIFEDFRPQINKIIDTICDIFENMSNDKYVKELQERLSIIADDLYWVDTEGKKRFNSDAAQELTVAIAGILRDQFQQLALPDVSGRDKDVQYALSNLNIRATLPDKIRLHLESDTVIDTSARASQERTSLQSELYLVASIRGVKLAADSVNFSYESTMYKEHGIMHVTVPSSSLDIYFVYSPSRPKPAEDGFAQKVENPITHQYQFLRVKTHFSVKEVDIDFDKSTLKHDLLSPALTSLYKPYLTYKFESGIEDALNNGLKTVGEKISGIIEQVPYSLNLSNYPSLRVGMVVE